MTARKLLQEEVSVPEAIVRVLEEAGIDMVFGMPGGNAMLPRLTKASTPCGPRPA